MNTLRSKLTEARAAKTSRKENGGIVENIIIIGIMVVICVVAGVMIANAVQTQASNVSNCITDARGAASGSGNCAMYR